MKNKIICFGEVLWDLLPTEALLGGAPLNVAVRLQSLGIQTQIISKIGNDALGQKLLEYTLSNNISTDLIDIDNQYNTGVVNVDIDKNGSPKYDIVFPSAWDNIVCNDQQIHATKNAHAIVFGSLSCRDNVTKSTLLQLLKYVNYKIFDVNLRPPFYTISLLEELMHYADFIKFNDEEIIEITTKLGCTKDTIEDQILFIATHTNTHSICVTKGSKGAILYHKQQFFYQDGFDVVVQDTIGAGDSFLAALIYKLIIEEQDSQDSLQFACVVGAIVASKKGANPEITEAEIDEKLNFYKK